jgi:hypothetical protein
VALGFGKGKEEDVVSLIAAKKYARAIEVLKAQLQKKGANPSLRMQLADVLILADKKPEAIGLLIPLADQFAREGFAAKAVSVLKKIQKIDPGRRDVEERLARQIEEKQREATGLPLARAGSPARSEPGFEEGPSLEIGMEAMEPVSAPSPVELPPAAVVASPDTTLPVGSSPEPTAAPLPMLELTPEPPPQRAPMPPRAPEVPSAPAVTAAPAPPAAAVLPDAPVLPLVEAEPAFVLAEPAFVPAAAALPTAAPPTAAAAAGSKPAEEEIEDYDLMYVAEDGDDETIDVPVEAELVEGDAKAEPMSAGQFADELMGLVDSVFQEFQVPRLPPLRPPGHRPPVLWPRPRTTSRRAAARSW